MNSLIEQIASVLETIPELPMIPTSNYIAETIPPQIRRSLASYIDHTLLKPAATFSQIEQLCTEAQQYGFASVCINPIYVSRCVRLLANSAVVVCTVVGFPLGATSSEVKVFEARYALEQGAREIDMVIPIGSLKSGDYLSIYYDIAPVAAICHAYSALCKVIIETALLTEAEKIMACMLAMRAGADFVKTSTGFAGGGATTADVSLMRRIVGSQIGVKASGGIRTCAEAKALLTSGANRLGTSAGVTIVTERTEIEADDY